MDPVACCFLSCWERRNGCALQPTQHCQLHVQVAQQLLFHDPAAAADTGADALEVCEPPVSGESLPAAAVLVERVNECPPAAAVALAELAPRHAAPAGKLQCHKAEEMHMETLQSARPSVRSFQRNRLTCIAVLGPQQQRDL